MNKFIAMEESQQLNTDNVFNRLLMKILPWIIALILVIALVLAMLILQKKNFQQEEIVTIRKINVALPLPLPPPPPPIELKESRPKSSTPTINLVGLGDGPAMKYSDLPSLGQRAKIKVLQPKFDLNSLDLRKTLSLDFPVVEVKNLDRIPTVVSSKYISPPKGLVSRGIKRIATKVDIIIDQTGKAYVNKIIDAVYPEMEAIIREWIKHARFTVPTKDGQAVQANYVYGLNFNYKGK